MEAFDPIVIKVKGDAGDVLAMLAGLKKAMREFESTSKTTSDHVGDDFKREGKAAGDSARVVTDAQRLKMSSFEGLRLKSRELRTEMDKLTAEFERTGKGSTLTGFQRLETLLGKVDARLKSITTTTGRGSRRGGLFGAIGDLAGQFKATMGSAPEGGGAFMGLSGGDLAIGGGVLLPGLLATIAATVNAGLVTGVGMGGLALGIKQQMDNPAVASAWDDFVVQGHDALTRGSDSLAGPLRDAVGSLGQEMDKFNFGQVFAPLAAEIKPLEQGFAMMVHNLLPGLNTAMRTAAPYLDILAHMLPSIGSAVTSMFNSFSKGAGGGKLALSYIISGLDLLIVGIGKFVQYGSDAFAWFVTTMVDVGDDVAHVGEKIFGWIPGIGPKFTELDKRTGQLRDSVNATARSGIAAFGDLSGAVNTANVSIRNQVEDLANLNKAYDDLLGKNMSLAQAQLALATDKATLSFKTSRHALDEHYAVGRANMQMLLGMVTDLKAVYDADVAVNGVTAANTKAYQSGIESLLAQATAAGGTASQIETLRGQFELLGTQMADMNGLVTNLYVRVHSSGTAGLSGGRGRNFYAQSGVHSFSAREPEHYDRSGVYAGRPGGYYMGESSTGDEALIGRTSNPGRAMAALVTAAAWRGMAVTPSRGGAFTGPQSGGYGGGGGGVAMADVYLDADKVGYAMVKWSNRFAGRSGVTIAGAVPGTTVGQAR